jgi:hypothetical protein
MSTIVQIPNRRSMPLDDFIEQVVQFRTDSGCVTCAVPELPCIEPGSSSCNAGALQQTVEAII